MERDISTAAQHRQHRQKQFTFYHYQTLPAVGGGYRIAEKKSQTIMYYLWIFTKNGKNKKT